MKSRIRVLSVDDHPLIREGIVAVINGQPDMQAVAQASNGHEAVECFGRHRPGITLMDLRLPDTSGIDVVIALRTHFPGARIIILTTFACDVEIQRALTAGAQSYLLKTMSPQEMVEVSRRVHAERKFVQPEVAAHLAEHFRDEPLTDRDNREGPSFEEELRFDIMKDISKARAVRFSLGCGFGRRAANDQKKIHHRMCVGSLVRI